MTTTTTDHTVTLVVVHGNGGGGFRFALAAPHVPTWIRFEAVTLREIADLPRPLVLLGWGHFPMVEEPERYAAVIMTSLVAAGSRELFEYYRRFDPALPTDRPFIEVFDGRPLINLSLMTDLVRSLRLPTRLVTDSIGGADHVAAGLRPARIVRRAPVLALRGAPRAATAPPARTWRGRLTWPLWPLARRPMAAREQFRADAMRPFLAIRRDLLRLAADAGIADDDLWLLDIDEVVALDRGDPPALETLAQRRAEQEARRARPIPEVVRRFGPLDPVADGGPDGATLSVLGGIGLVARCVEGVA